MTGADPVVSIIVPALNEEQNLPPLFQRLLDLTRKLDQPVEILLVDDASTDGTLRVAEEWARGHPEIRVHHKPLPHGLGRGIRAGIEQARGRIGVVVMADGVDPLESARREAEDYKDRWMRSVAEFDNYRKRTQREMGALLETATEGVISLNCTEPTSVTLRPIGSRVTG